MRQRVRSPNNPSFELYGGRGIRICDRWDSFLAFLHDVGPRPSSRHSLERLDNDGHYEPGNVVWALPGEQMRNTRRNVFYEHGGQRLTLSEWARNLGVTLGMLRNRIKAGWPPERVFASRIKKTKPRRVVARAVLDELRAEHERGVPQRVLAKRYKMSLGTIGDVVNDRPLSFEIV